MTKKIILTLGAPGTGKGTHGKKIATNLGIPHISTGEILRSAQSENKKLKRILESGEFVQDEFMIQLIKQRIENDDCANGFVLDGFPRTFQQAKALDLDISVIFAFKAPQKVLVERLTGRMECSSCQKSYHTVDNPPQKKGICDDCGNDVIQRSDDNLESAQTRLKVFEEKTQPVIDFYRNSDNFIEISTDNNPTIVAENIQNNLDIILSKTQDQTYFLAERVTTRKR